MGNKDKQEVIVNGNKMRDKYHVEKGLQMMNIKYKILN